MRRRVIVGTGVALLLAIVGLAWWKLVTGGFGQLHAGILVGLLLAFVAGIDAWRRQRSMGRDSDGLEPAD